MKIIFTAFILTFAVTTVLAKPADQRYLVTEDQFGVIHQGTTYQDQVNLFGKDKLKEETLSGPEGQGEFKVTIVYKGSPLEMTIYWAEKKWHSKISSVECSQLKSPYYTKDSLKIGSNLNALIKVNKAPVSFYGFAWDYGGMISDFHKGKLATSKVHFSLSWNGKDDTTLLGDGTFKSTLQKVVQRAKQIYISKMVVNWAE